MKNLKLFIFILSIITLVFYGCNKENDTIEKEIPTITSSEVTYITNSTAKIKVVISDLNSNTITETGICWSTSSEPSISNNKIPNTNVSLAFTSTISNLTSGSIYYARAYATYEGGTVYGTSLSIETTEPFTDIDGNSYNCITINGDTWMTENLKVNHYRNGDLILEIPNSQDWDELDSSGYCYYDNDPSYNSIYGKLYNSYAIDDSRGLSPDGWHVATFDEWNRLINSFENAEEAGNALCNAETNVWEYENNANNSSGFNALPGGLRDWYPNFNDIKTLGHFWTSDYLYGQQLSVKVQPGDAYITNNEFDDGLSIRCVKNK